MTSVLAVRTLTGQILDPDLQITDLTWSIELSGPGGVFGTIDPALRHDKGPDGRPIIEEWGTSLFVVEDDEIRAGGIVSPVSDRGTKRAAMAPGYAGYANDQPYLGNFIPDNGFEEPMAIIRKLHAHLRAFPDGDISLEIEGAPTYMIVGDGTGPFKFLETDYRDVGQTIESVQAAARIEYVEKHYFTDLKAGRLRHVIQHGFPRVGRRRDDLRFAQDENVIDYGEIGADGDSFSQDVTMIGNGEGYAAIAAGMVHRVAVPDGRVRRAKVISDSSLRTPGMVQRAANDEFAARALTPNISEVVVKDHPNARISSIGVGDDIAVDIDTPHRGVSRTWLRVVSIEQGAGTPGVATLKTARSETFQYASATNPSETGEPFLVTI